MARDSTAMEHRLNVILLERLAVTCLAVVASLGVLTLLSALRSEWLVAGTSLTAQIAAWATWRGIRHERIPAAWAGATSFGVWICAELSVLVALWTYRDQTQEIWLALLLWAYGAMQLQPRWFIAALVVGVSAWGGILVALAIPASSLHFVTIAGAAGISAVAFGANRAVVWELERLRAIDRNREMVLENALQAAQDAFLKREFAEAERETIRGQFIRAQRLEAVGTLAGGLAHDMNNILAGILGMAEGLRARALCDAAADRDLQAIIQSGQRGVALTRSLLGFSRQAQYRKERLSLADVVNTTQQLLVRTLPKSMTLELRLDKTLFVDADRGHLEQAVMNVAINAAQACGAKGHITFTLRSTALDAASAERLGVTPGDFATIRIEDNGPGMDDAVQSRLFDPFFTTKTVGEGTGLGLAMVWGMLQSHGGTAIVNSELGRGTRMDLLLPQQNAPASVREHPTPKRALSAHHGRILVVDDEDIVRRVTVRALQRKGYHVSEAVDGLDALEIFKAAPEPFDGVVLDMSMPRMSGAECYRALRGLQADLPIVCVSGYALDVDAREHLGGDVSFLTKPFRAAALVEVLAEAIDARPESEPPLC